MFTFAVNLTLLFTETPFLERLARARAAGFRHVEFHNPLPYDQDIPSVIAAVNDLGLQVIHFNLPVPNWEQGERGIACAPDGIAEFRASVAQAIALAKQLGCRQLNCPVGNRRPQVTLEAQQRTMIENLRYAADATAKENIMLLIEPLNPITHPDYMLTTTRQACELQDRVGADNLKIQYDYYQMQRSEGELAETVRKNFARIGFVQLADNPGRHQPGTGEVNFRFLLRDLTQSGYAGYVSLEYIPQGTSEQALAWLQEFGYSL